MHGSGRLIATHTSKPQLLAEGTQNQAKSNGPDQVQHVTEPAERPQVPLILAHAERVHLAVDQDAFLFVQRDAVVVQVMIEREAWTVCILGQMVFPRVLHGWHGLIVAAHLRSAAVCAGGDGKI